MNNYENCRRLRRYGKAKPAYEALMKFYPLTLDNLSGELWKPIPDYDGYRVSNFGRVKSFKYKTPRIITPTLASDGYLYVHLRKSGKNKGNSVHRLVALCFIPNPEGKPQVNHIDGHPLNNHVSNLEWATNAENQRHAFNTGLQVSGENHYNAKLTAEQAQYIRENPDGLTQEKLASLFSVGHTAIGNIQIGKTYRNAGGSVRDKLKERLSDDVRTQIRAEYVFGSHEFGLRALAKKYGVTPTTICNIIHENNAEK